MQADQDKKGQASSLKNDDGHWFERIISTLDQNIRGVQLGIYTVAFCGLGIALRSVRPFKKFTSPNQIPKTFFESNIKLNGKVCSVDVSNKPILLVDHYPVLGSKFRSVGPLLPVEIEGVNISNNGVSWLQTIVKGENIEFILLKKYPNSVSCIVTMKKRNIGKHLVTLGFASVQPFNLELKSLDFFCKYYAELLKAEELAEKKGAGIWTTGQKRFNVTDLLAKVFVMLKLSFHKFQLLRLKT